MIANTDNVSLWKSKRLAAEITKPPSASDNIHTPALSYYGTKTRVKFTESCLKQSTISYNHRPIINICIVYVLGASGSHIDDPALKKYLFRQLLWLKYFDKYGYSGYVIGFDRKSSFTFLGSGMG